MKNFFYFLAGLFLTLESGYCCTGVTLHAKNGDVVYGRTLEWGAFDLESALFIYPRNYIYQVALPDGVKGLTWEGRYGIAGIDLLGRGILADAMNEKGLAAGLFYHPGFAQYPPLTAENQARALAPTDVVQYILSNCATVADVRQALARVEVVAIIEPALGVPAPIHMIVSDPTGKQLVVEWTDGKMKIYDAPLGVITNAPNYDWHLTNLRNYLELSGIPHQGKEMYGQNFAPLGGGTGMLGLPGDFTPPSRFIRVTNFSATARPTPDGDETVYEVFRILDNFNVPLGVAEGNHTSPPVGSRSGTIWTSAQNLAGKKFYYHTQDNRQVQMLSVGEIDFETLKSPLTMPLDLKKNQSILNRTPGEQPKQEK